MVAGLTGVFVRPSRAAAVVSPSFATPFVVIRVHCVLITRPVGTLPGRVCVLCAVWGV